MHTSKKSFFKNKIELVRAFPVDSIYIKINKINTPQKNAKEML